MKNQIQKKRQVRFLSRSRFFVAMLIVLQILFLMLVLAGSSLHFSYANMVLQVVSIIVCIHIINKTGKTAYKLTWLFLILFY